MPQGRPSDYTLETALEICARLAEGQSLRAICRDETMPDARTVFRWLEVDEDFRQQYARAREAQADALADEIVDIADTPVLGKKTKTTADGVEVTEGDMIEHRRLQVDARKWTAAKLRPKKYGEKIDHSLTGRDGGPIIIQSTPVDEAL